MTYDDVKKKIEELRAKKTTMDSARSEAEKAMAIKQVEVGALQKIVTENTWETTTQARELEQYEQAVAIMER